VLRECLPISTIRAEKLTNALKSIYQILITSGVQHDPELSEKEENNE
jgi:hypothetical protein